MNGGRHMRLRLPAEVSAFTTQPRFAVSGSLGGKLLVQNLQNSVTILRKVACVNC